MGSITEKEKELASKHYFSLEDYVDPTPEQRTKIKNDLEDPELKNFKKNV